MTPEGKVKSNIKKLLDIYKPRLYYFMPVPSGYGVSTLDFIGALNGQFFAIEAKAPGKRPTQRQDGVIADVIASGAWAFVVEGEIGMPELEAWLERTK